MTEEKIIKTEETNELDAEKIVDDEVTLEVEKDVLTEIPSEEAPLEPVKKNVEIEGWKPKTGVGKKVKDGLINDIDDILDAGLPILEPEIVDSLVPDLQNELLLIGQSKGKFGGGARRIFKQTQKKTPEGNKPSFSCIAVVGNGDGYVGVGSGKSKDTVPAREKAIRIAKLNLFKIKRGCGSWECNCGSPHTIPMAIEGKCGSVRIKLMPAPKGKGLCVEQECQKVLRLAGIRDVWSKTFGQTRVKTNLIAALVDALKKLSESKFNSATAKRVGLVEGKIKRNENE
ncbi:MAG TPA: 30S ribosomal protein S5 [Candidatus Woesearchaeota archaeon]|nr:MAG: 30S ribosomal protein S5 [Candidatus Woesearchaeota archaeon]HDD70557.1 30S ribosomal protein S5 [Candidatus Woesearchaeota archaeon]